jgi:hypothetical protein
MAADAVGLHNPLLTLRNVDSFRHPAGIIHGNVPQPVDGFPEVVDPHVLVGQVTVHTLDCAMGAHPEPGLVVGLHGVARPAKEGRFRFGHEVRGPETQIKAGHRDDKTHKKDPDKNLPPVLVKSAHFFRNLTRMIISLVRRKLRGEKDWW